MRTVNIFYTRTNLHFALMLTGVLAFMPLAFRAAAQTTNGANNETAEREFGKLEDGTVVQEFTLRNTNGMTVKAIGFGAIITDVEVPDRDRTLTNVVLGTDSLDRYVRGFNGAAVVLGRVANRIAGARFTLDGVEYKLAANNGTNSLHGGRKGFSQVVWEGRLLKTGPHEAAVQFTYQSHDSEEGYPGNLTAKVTYTVTDSNELRVDYQAVTDKATPVNLSNHAYWNLGGNGDVSSFELWLAADHYTPTDAQLIPTGEIAPVKDTALDFTTPTAIGVRAGQLTTRGRIFDNSFVINDGGKSLTLAARVRDPKSGRTMEVRTTQPGLQLYTGNRRAFCLETQHFPDSVNHPNFPSTILRPGEAFRSTTVYSFSAK